MNAWFHLVKKELHNGALAFFSLLIGFLVVGGMVFYFSSRAEVGAEGLMIFTAAAIMMHVFYLLYYLFVSLHNERKKLHLWLHNSLPSYSLLLAKVAAGLISMGVSLTIVFITFFISSQYAEYFHDQLSLLNLTELSLFGSVHIILIALSFAAWFLLYAMVHFAIRSRLNGFLSFLCTAIFVVVTLRAYSWFAQTNLYETLTMWGAFQPPEIVTGLEWELTQNQVDLSMQGSPFTLFIGSYVLETIVSITIFLLACWLLERKVEV
ncbi:hypothetical protein [Halalkalibacter sp. APA_J-10(15)]|uniref:hypothetical protein n=1 Tax=unclassified Halalkalibacter TaxID=2893063 RepID=UPI001FF404F3|nr:hypothetical protein [Halalkalibacter sp. APA_J-10(15)]MCK0471844.1 hypothetical protein [Halalkalibacter sp. APA_J-10(15)]